MVEGSHGRDRERWALVSACDRQRPDAAWTTAYDPSKAAVSVALYVFCAACVELLRRHAPLPANATLFQIVQAAGGVCGGWLASYVQ